MTQNATNNNGRVVQFLTTNTNATTLCNTAFPYDNTIPQSSEGTQILTVSITPISPSSNLLVEASIAGKNITDLKPSMAIFRDSGSDAIAAIGETLLANTAKTLYLRVNVSSGSTVATTFKLRCGTESTNGIQLNVDTGGTRIFGGVSFAWLTVKEIL